VKIHEKYIKRCLDLAKNGLPSAMPNPSVGAVIVFENKIIGEDTPRHTEEIMPKLMPSMQLKTSHF